MWNRGKLVIVAMLGVGLCAAAFAAWYQYRGQHRAHDHWGTTSAVLIAEAPQVTVLSLGESGPQEESTFQDQTADSEAAAPRRLEFGERSWQVLSTKDGRAAPGIKNIRRALVLDTTFDWNALPLDEEPEWQYAIGFTDNRNWATVLFDFETGRVALTGAKKTARLDPAANKELQEFFTEQFADEASQPPAETPAEEPSGQAPVEQPPEKPAEKPADESGGAPADAPSAADEKK
jgi:hypothetical protein